MDLRDEHLAAMKSKSDFVVWLESPTGEKTPLGEKCILGRAKDCQVILNSEMTSRRHAMIYRQGEHEFWVADLGSANGTRLNGRHLSQHRRLSDRDKVEFGDTVFIFRQPDSPVANRQDASPVFATALDLRSFNCWLLVADMIGSTAMVRRLPDDEAARMTRALLAQWKEIVEKHQGAVNKFLGDGFLAYWPDAAGVGPEVLAALEAFERLQAEAQTPFRLVLHYGLATSGGAPSMGEESLTGKEVNFAFRMEDLASTLGAAVLLSEAASLKIGTQRKLLSHGRHGLAGFGGEFEFFGF
jgi:class 3 adenylate cyclase